MKTLRAALRAGTAALLCVLCAVICSCSDAGGDPLAYQSYPLRADCTLVYGGADPTPEISFSAEVYGRGQGKLVFSDGELAGYAISVAPEGAVLTDGDGFEIPLDPDAGSPVRAVVAAFSLLHTDILSRSSEKEGKPGRIKASFAGGTVEVTARDGIPVTLDLATDCGNYTVHIISFSNNGQPG